MDNFTGVHTIVCSAQYSVHLVLFYQLNVTFLNHYFIDVSLNRLRFFFLFFIKQVHIIMCNFYFIKSLLLRSLLNAKFFIHCYLIT